MLGIHEIFYAISCKIRLEALYWLETVKIFLLLVKMICLGCFCYEHVKSKDDRK